MFLSLSLYQVSGGTQLRCLIDEIESLREFGLHDQARLATLVVSSTEVERTKALVVPR